MTTGGASARSGTGQDLSQAVDRLLPIIDANLSVSMMLCDTADILDEKLVVRGGGWTSTSSRTTSHALGVTVQACPTSEGRPIDLNLVLVDHLGAPVPMVTTDGMQPTRVKTTFTLPRAVHADVPVSTNIAVTMPWVELSPGHVVHWIATIDQAPTMQWSCSFYVTE